eukprot:CAMPEP_0114546554 /NCGR_PEP_ID=MMETSP0114-20121206/3994_1 /TAXON_ID=31324 /ORGANISM="Goniomonas sp, Strain m" /LENGTH=559 /DNA_ID=CAMNT_0001731053 /DNA_START=8 /DNA_END=1687 /DNA_ORIENTATION=+
MRALAVAIAVLSLPLVTGMFKWEAVLNNGTAPQPRTQCAYGLHLATQTFVIFGGKGDGNAILDDTWLFHLGTKQWQKLSPLLSPAPRFHGVGAIDAPRNRFLVTLGEGPKRIFYSDVWSLDLTSFVWSELQPTGDIPAARYGAAGGIFPGTNFFYVTHGFSKIRYSDTFRLKLVNGSDGEWERVFDGTNSYNPWLPHARCLHGAAMVQPDDLVMFGGCLSGGSAGGPCPSNDAWRFSQGSWGRVASCPNPRVYTDMAMMPGYPNHVVMYGGQEKAGQMIAITVDTAEEVDVLDYINNGWIRGIAGPLTAGGGVPPRRAKHAMVTTDTGILVFGGQSLEQGKPLLNDMWHLTGFPDMVQPNTYGGCPTWFTIAWLHGILMIIGWGICLQAGGFIARYFRHLNPLWFKLHRGLQVAGLVIATAGLVLGGLSTAGGHFAFAHGAIGIVIMILGISQPIGAIFRPHPEQPNRKYFNWIHWTAGRLALVLALCNIPLGMLLIMAPTGLWAFWIALEAAFVLLYVVFEIRKRRAPPKAAPAPEAPPPEPRDDGIQMTAPNAYADK